MATINFRNARRFAVPICVLAVFSLSCSFLGRSTEKNKQSSKTNSFNYSVPFGLASAHPDSESNSDSRFVVLLTFATRAPDHIDLKVGRIDSSKVDLSGIAEGLKIFTASRKSGELVAYVAAEEDIPQDEIMSVVGVIQEHGLTKVRFLVSSFERFPSGKARESNREEWVYPDVPAPDKVLEAQIQQPPPPNVRPNPLTLVVSIEGSNKLYLNNEPYESEESLQTKLADIFKTRTENGVLLENSNEVERTVILKLNPEQSGFGKSLSYRQFVQLIDRLKQSGASPIVLANRASPNDLNDPPELRQPLGSNVPNAIFSGVLNEKATSLPKPTYPPAARAVRALGAVSVQVTVDEAGNVIEANAVSGHPLLRAAAAQAARGAKFSPTLVEGRPVKITGVITYNFAPPD